MAPNRKTRTQAQVLQRPGEIAGVLVRPRRKSRSRQEILAACERRLLACLAGVCRWPGRERDRTWRIGDYSFLVLHFGDARKSRPYVQVWSEPDEVGVTVIVSGAEPRTMASASGARGQRTLARTVVRVLCDQLGYDGRTRLEYRLHLGTRLQSRPVFDAIRPNDLAKLLRSWGFPADLDRHDDDHNVILSAVGEQPFFIAFVGEHPEGSREYGMVELRTYFSFEDGVPDGLANAINQNFVSAKASVDEEGDLIVQTALLLHGGVTEPSLALGFGIWKETIEEIANGLE